MAFESLSDKLTEAFKRLRGKGRLTEADVKEAMREVKLALLEADVNFKVVKDFVRKVTERATGVDVLESLSPAQMVIKIVNDELTELMGGSEAARIQELLHALREPYKEVFMWRVYGEKSFRDIGALFGKTENWACVTYHRAKRMIRDGLED